MSHTQEPWHICAAGDCGCGHILDAGSHFVARANSAANQRRIVSCVNACEGVHENYLNTVTDEGGAAKFFKERDTYRDLCGELLEELKIASGLVKEVCDINGTQRPNFSLNRLDSAITKAEAIMGENSNEINN